jgi:hypothetical protein
MSVRPLPNARLNLGSTSPATGPRIHMYGETAVAVGVFRMKEMEKGKLVTHRERTVDTWVKVGGTWKCVAAVAVKIPTGN